MKKRVRQAAIPLKFVELEINEGPHIRWIKDNSGVKLMPYRIVIVMENRTGRKRNDLPSR